MSVESITQEEMSYLKNFNEFELFWCNTIQLPKSGKVMLFVSIVIAWNDDKAESNWLFYHCVIHCWPPLIIGDHLPLVIIVFFLWRLTCRVFKKAHRVYWFSVTASNPSSFKTRYAVNELLRNMQTHISPEKCNYHCWFRHILREPWNSPILCHTCSHE